HLTASRQPEEPGQQMPDKLVFVRSRARGRPTGYRHHFDRNFALEQLLEIAIGVNIVPVRLPDSTPQLLPLLNIACCPFRQYISAPWPERRQTPLIRRRQPLARPLRVSPRPLCPHPDDRQARHLLC